jgi:putative glycerol-1-phosphate prenyltransferase
MKTFKRLLNIKEKNHAGYFVLLDPDKKSIDELVDLAKICEDQGVDGLLIGGSLLFSVDFDQLILTIKRSVSIPVIIFPGNGRQLSGHADALLFLSLISGRNPNTLIGEQVHSAPLIHALGLEAISTGYMLIESGCTTAAEFMSNTRPIPRAKPEIAVAHALAAEYLGMKFIYLEGGSGAQNSVPEQMIKAIYKTISLPVIVGGGIRTPEEARSKVKAGASFIVTGNILEGNQDVCFIKALAQAIHTK